MELSDLKIFNTVVEEGGITRAARRLHRVQSNVTTRVRRLEEDLGVDLFIREGKRLHLSPAGEKLLGYSERLLSLAAEARSALENNEPGGLFRLGAMESTAAVRLPGPITALHKKFADIDLELQTGNPRQLLEKLRNGELDAALVGGAVDDAWLDRMRVYKEEVVVVTASKHPPIDRRHGLPESVIVFEDGCPHRKLLEDWYRDRGVTPGRIIELGSYHAMLSCVVAGMGAGLLPRAVLRSFPGSEHLNVHTLPQGRNLLTTWLVWRKGAATPNLEVFREVLRYEQEDS